MTDYGSTKQPGDSGHAQIHRNIGARLDQLTDEALASTIVSVGSDNFQTLSAVLESVPIYREGDSYDDGSQGADQASRPFARLAARFNMGTATKTSVAGTRSDEMTARIISSFGSNRRGMVGIGDGILNDVFQYGATTKESTTAAAFRTAFAWCSSRAVNAYSTAAFFFGPGWTAGASSTAASYVDVAFTAADAYLAVSFVTGAGGTLKVYDAGALVQTITTGGFAQNFTGVIHLTGSASVAKTYRVVLDSGSATISNLVVSSPTPPLIVWDQVGPLNRSGAEDTRIALYNAAVETVAAEFSNVVVATMGAGWEAATMISGEDFIHRNDAGNAFATTRIQEAILAALPASPTQGLNRINASGNAGTYTIPTVNYVGSGATAPSAPATPTVSPSDTTATVSWARPADGGSTITGWSLQYRVVGAGSWTTYGGTIAARDTSAPLTGLTAATNYEARIAAINQSGTSSYSAAGTFTTLAVVTVYSADTFNRANGALGNTETGAQAWTVTGGTASINANQLYFDTVTTFGTAYVNDGQSDGTFRITRMAATNNGWGGLFFRGSSDTSTGYIVWTNSGNYRLSKRTAISAYTTLADSSGVTPAPGDVIEVVAVGSSIKVRINGVERINITDASYAGTRHGGWTQVAAASSVLDNWQHTDATA